MCEDVLLCFNVCVCDFHQNDRYLVLTAQLYDAKDMAATGKLKKDKASQRMAQDRIRIIQQGPDISTNHRMTSDIFHQE